MRRLGNGFAPTFHRAVDILPKPPAIKEGANMDDKKSLLTTLPPLLVAAGTLITAVIGLGNFMSTPAPTITEFDVNPSIIDSGGNATLKWTVSGDVTSVSIDPGIGVVALSGSRQVSPENSTNYVLTAKNKDKAKTASAQLVVRDAKAVLENNGSIQDNNGSIQDNSSSSIKKPALVSIPAPVNTGDEPVQMGVPVSANAVNTIDTTNTAKTVGQSRADIKDSVQKPTQKDVSNSANTGDEPALMSESKITQRSADMPKGMNAPANTGDEPISMSELKGTDTSKNVTPTDTTINSVANASTEINKTAESATSAPTSNVGDVA